DDELESLAAIARRLGAQVVESSDPTKEILTQIRGKAVLYYGQSEGSYAWACAKKLMLQDIVASRDYPIQFKHADILFNQLRLVKDESEIKLIRDAIAETHDVFSEVLPFVKSGATELALRDRFLQATVRRGREVSFKPIVGTGVSAAKPHYSAFKRSLKSSELLLVDYGLECSQYAAYITRVFPVSGKFSDVHREVYEIVLEAKKVATRKMKPGASFQLSQAACETVLIEGLKELGILRGKTSVLRAKGAHKQYTIHSASHSLGLDVHDISKDRFTLLDKLKTGMVLTIEPGLYFNSRTKHIPACGIRLEDDILISKAGSENLSKQIPIEIEDVEAWMRQ
ncbi:MAG: M24 family metallopeptidase, partial [Bdellovibrionales bacterium]|nr:M24 family metallopeptidase [Bdellovibrionales bacterium]